ncbi:hypothetical protein [Spirillospora sp. NPDC029432]|uniref:hypothetical protein n=1 Tax=Spirillospora sp. NPDC029432 TaxID=3154599 RepID=UPI003456F7B8
MTGAHHPAWGAKTLGAMTVEDLHDLRAVLCRETPPDCALLRAVDGRLDALEPAPAPVPAPVPEPEPAPVTVTVTRDEDEYEDEYEESDDWALDG